MARRTHAIVMTHKWCQSSLPLSTFFPAKNPRLWFNLQRLGLYKEIRFVSWQLSAKSQWSAGCWINGWLIASLSLRDNASPPFALTHCWKIRPLATATSRFTKYFSPLSRDARQCTIFRRGSSSTSDFSPGPEIHERVFAVGGGTEDTEHGPRNTRPETRDTERRTGWIISDLPLSK